MQRDVDAPACRPGEHELEVNTVGPEGRFLYCVRCGLGPWIVAHDEPDPPMRGDQP